MTIVLFSSLSVYFLFSWNNFPLFQIFWGSKQLWLYIIYWEGVQPVISYWGWIVLGTYCILIWLNIYVFSHNILFFRDHFCLNINIVLFWLSSVLLVIFLNITNALAHGGWLILLWFKFKLWGRTDIFVCYWCKLEYFLEW